ncbi:MAG: arylamine N-acetyltransferase [Acidimicrobiales bacterium]
MQLSPADRSAYLERIGIDAVAIDVPPSLESLRALHVAHLERVPFENLDIHVGRAIELDEHRILDKIVHRRRGGFCYELNSAFAALLTSLGYEVTLAEARVFDGDDLGIAFDHLCLLVDVDRRYLVDVGFGDSFVAPLVFEPDVEQQDRAGRFTIEAVGDGWFDLIRNGRPQYRFSPTPRALDDFAPGCHHHQTAQASGFTRRPLASRLTPTGRLTLTGMSLHEKTDGIRTETPVAPDDLGRVLAERFGLGLADDDLGLLVDASGRGQRCSTRRSVAVGSAGWSSESRSSRCRSGRMPPPWPVLPPPWGSMTQRNRRCSYGGASTR